MTRIARSAFILTFTAIAMLMVGPDLMLPLHPYSTFGLRVDPYGTIKSVDPVTAAAGLHVGDRTHYLPGDVETLTTLTHSVGSALALLTLPSPDGGRFDNLRGASLEPEPK